ncbi:MAG: hypothetical protein JHC87_06580 [Thermoleophilaceae bacterium]|nr:hypothetical protein [Thermoleophilaceae bacterium]
MKFKVTLVAALAAITSLAAFSNASAAVSPELQAALGVFRAAPALYPVTAGQLPSEVLEMYKTHPTLGGSVDASAARGVNAGVTGGQVVLVPAGQGVCFSTPNLLKTGGVAGCSSLADIQAGLAFSDPSGDSVGRKRVPPVTFTAVVPDSVHYITFVTFHGERIKVPAHDNIVEAELSPFKSFIMNGVKHKSGYKQAKAKHHKGK